MNDELTGQLCDTYRIPAYADGLLWLSTDSESVPVEGETGLFELSMPAQTLTLRWGAADGAALTQLRWQPDNLAWNGSVRLGGMIQALHLVMLPRMEDFPLLLLDVEAQPLLPATKQATSGRERRNYPYTVPDFFDGIDGELDPDFTTWLLPEESALAGLVQDAMMNHRNVNFYGTLAPQDDPWHAHFALPILLERVSLFAR
ncbi:MAG: hypothetical protein ACPG7F_03750 [Aggregatilineales bacterium]